MPPGAPHKTGLFSIRLAEIGAGISICGVAAPFVAHSLLNREEGFRIGLRLRVPEFCRNESRQHHCRLTVHGEVLQVELSYSCLFEFPQDPSKSTAFISIDTDYSEGGATEYRCHSPGTPFSWVT